MGNQFTVNAAEEKKGYFTSFWRGSDGEKQKQFDDIVPPTSSTTDPLRNVGDNKAEAVSVGGSGDAVNNAVVPSASKAPGTLPHSNTDSNSSIEDPRTIMSSLPSFPGTWNDLHKVKGNAQCFTFS